MYPYYTRATVLIGDVVITWRPLGLRALQYVGDSLSIMWHLLEVVLSSELNKLKLCLLKLGELESVRKYTAS